MITKYYKKLKKAVKLKPKVIDKPWIKVVQGQELEKEVDLSPAPRFETIIDVNATTGKREQRVQLVSAGNVYSGTSIENALKQGYGPTTQWYNYFESTAVLRKCINLIGNFTTHAGFETTVKCLDPKDDPNKPEYQKVKQKVDDLNRTVNMDNVLLLSVIKRQLYGNCGWTMITSNGQITGLMPLYSAYMTPRVDEKTGEITGITYSYALTSNNFIPKERLLYFSLDTFEATTSSYMGVSSCRSVARNIRIKKNLERDLLYASRSLWAPIVIYQAETRGLTPNEKGTLFNELKAELKPGAVVVTNMQVAPKVIQYNPDLNNLIRAIEKQDEEIIGNYGIPKALLSREKTIARATLEYSIRSFYESTVAGEQIYFKRQLEKQWYDPIVKALGYDDKIRIRHEWRPIIDPESDLITALVRAFEAGVVSAEEFFRRLGWELDRVIDKTKDVPDEKPEEKV